MTINFSITQGQIENISGVILIKLSYSVLTLGPKQLEPFLGGNSFLVSLIFAGMVRNKVIHIVRFQPY
jgi:hypothetical protein